MLEEEGTVGVPETGDLTCFSVFSSFLLVFDDFLGNWGVEWADSGILEVV